MCCSAQPRKKRSEKEKEKTESLFFLFPQPKIIHNHPTNTETRLAVHAFVHAGAMEKEQGQQNRRLKPFPY